MGKKWYWIYTEGDFGLDKSLNQPDDWGESVLKGLNRIIQSTHRKNS